MDVTSISSLATDLKQSATAQSVGVAILKKAIDMETTSALTLINSISATSASLSSHLGQSVNTVA
jgi:hypothetical protein